MTPKNKQNVIRGSRDSIFRKIAAMTSRQTVYVSIAAVALVVFIVAYVVYSPAVITVNGQKLSKRRFQALLQEQIRRVGQEVRLRNMVFDQKSPDGAQIVDNIRKSLVDKQIDNILLYQEAVRRGFVVSDDRVDDHINALRTQSGEKNFAMILKQKGLKERDLREDVKAQFSVNAFLNDIVRDIIVKDKEALEYYQNNRWKFERRDVVKVRHILTTTREDAEECLREIRAGADFADVARQKSKETIFAPKGGLWGYLARGQMPQPMENTAFSLKPGEVSDIIEADGQFHIIKVDEVKRAGLVPYEEIRENVVDELLKLRQQTAIENLLSELRRKSIIEINI